MVTSLGGMVPYSFPLDSPPIAWQYDRLKGKTRPKRSGHTGARTDGVPSVVVFAVDSGNDITLVDAASEAVTAEAGYGYEAAIGAECHRSVFNHRRRYTTRVYNDIIH